LLVKLEEIMNRIKVSIITVCFNSAKTIEDTIKSVIEQTYDNIEFLIIDGNSTDTTKDIIKSYAESVHVFISENDSGLYDAMNKGMEFASGDIIGILNSDDILADKNTIEEIASKFIEDANLDCLYADVGFYDENLQKKKRHYSSSGFSPRKLKYGIMPAHPSLYIKNEIIKSTGKYSISYKIAADFDYIVRLFSRETLKSLYLNKEVVKMRVGGISTAGFKANILLNQEILHSLASHNISSNVFYLLLKYPKKIIGFITR